MPWGRSGGQNIDFEFIIIIIIIIIFFFFFFFFCFRCILVLLVRRSSGELHCSGTALIIQISTRKKNFFSRLSAKHPLREKRLRGGK